MFYSKAAYNRHNAAIDIVESLGSAAVAHEGYIERAEAQYADIGEVIEFFGNAPELQKDLVKMLSPVLQGHYVGGFYLKTLEAACDRMRRKCKGKLMATISMLKDGEQVKENRPNLAITTGGKYRSPSQFRQKWGYEGSIKG